jgi:hypothetical protein
MSSLRILTFLLLPAAAYAAEIKTELTLAARRLGEKTNYSWTQTRVLENTNSPAKIVPLDGRFRAPATIYLTQDRLDPDWEAIWKLCGYTNLTSLRESIASSPRYTNELAILRSRCAIKSQWLRGCVTGAPKDWEGYSSPRPPLYGGYYISLTSVPHFEIQQFIAASEGINFDAGSYLLTFAPDRLMRVRTNRAAARILASEGWTRLWISNALPTQYETRIVETSAINGGFWAPCTWLTNSATNHFLTKIHGVGTTKFEIPVEALRAMTNATNALHERE